MSNFEVRLRVLVAISQFEKTKPICETETNVSSTLTMDYHNISDFGLRGNKANQSQFQTLGQKPHIIIEDGAVGVQPVLRSW